MSRREESSGPTPCGESLESLQPNVPADRRSIDQRNVEEVNHHVHQMKTVYEEGMQTLIWLGPDPDGQAAVAFPAIQRLAFAILRKSDTPYRELSLCSDFVELLGPASQLYETSRFSDEEWDAIGALLSNRWFTRVWVIQEFNSNLARTAWGEREIDSLLVTLVASYIWYDARRTNYLWARTGLIVAYAAQMGTWYFRSPGNDYHRTLISLNAATTYHAVEPKDRIYARLGSLPFLKEHIKPDYSLSTADVLFTTAEVFVKHGKGLEMLCFVHHVHGSREDGCSCLEDDKDSDWETGLRKRSWVPRWDCPNRANLIIILRNHVDFNASLRRYSSDPFFREISLNQELLVDALIVDGVTSAETLDLQATGLSFHTYGEDTDTYGPHYLSRWYDLLKRGHGMQTDKEVFDAYERTLSGGYQYGERISKQVGRGHDQGSLALYLVDLLRTVEGGPDDTIASFRRRFDQKWVHPDGIKVPHPANTNNFQPLSFIQCIESTQKWRKFIRTERGCIGTAPGKTEPGDKVAVVLGCPVPIILRQRGDGTYFMVGESFVDGMMFGEVVRDFNAGKLPSVKKKRDYDCVVVICYNL